MSSFTPDISRSLKIMGTKGQIKAHQDSDTIIVSDFISRKDKEIKVTAEGGHGGGDKGIAEAIIRYFKGGTGVPGVSEISISADNHMLSFAAEKSRLSGGKVVEMSVFEG